MRDPIMAKGSSRAATAPITVKPSGLSCEAELYLTKDGGATKAATSSPVSFVATGAAQPVSFPITMPSVWGDFEVYIDAFADGMLIGAFIATEHVTIPDVSIGEPVWD